MQLNTTKIFNDDLEYITLFELSKAQHYSLEYLLNAASRGKLKSFKIGDDWVTTKDWFEDYKKSIKKSIQIEISSQDLGHKKDWVDFMPQENSSFRFLPQMFLLLLIFSCFSFSLSWLAFSASGHKYALSANSLVEGKYIAGGYFLYYTDKVYSYNSRYLSYVVDNSFNSIGLIVDSLVDFGQSATVVALAVDQKIGPYKISDEVITDQISRLTDVIKNKYQAVAGESSTANYIYFEDWKKSSESDK